MRLELFALGFMEQTAPYNAINQSIAIIASQSRVLRTM